jgi:hypothetical protein
MLRGGLVFRCISGRALRAWTVMRIHNEHMIETRAA